MQSRDPGSSALLTDLYQLTMLQTYYEHGMTDTAVFELFFRRLPPKARNFFVAAGLEQVVEFLEGLAFLARGARLAGAARTGSHRSTLDQLAQACASPATSGRHSRGHGVLRQRAHHPRRGAAAGGSAGGNADHEHPAFPDHDRQQGRARGLAGARQAAGGLRLAPRPRRRGRPLCSARHLSRRDVGHGHRARGHSGTACRSSAPWRTPSFRPTTARCRRSRTSRAAIPTTSPS